MEGTNTRTGSFKKNSGGIKNGKKWQVIVLI